MTGGGKLELLMEVLNLLPNPVSVKNANHDWVEVNDAFCRFVGLPREDLIGQPDREVFPNEQADIFREIDDRVLETRTQIVTTEQISNAAGDLRWVESSTSFFQDAAGSAFIVSILTDVTELKKQEAELAESRRLQELQRGRLVQQEQRIQQIQEQQSRAPSESAYGRTEQEVARLLKSAAPSEAEALTPIRPGSASGLRR